MNRISKQLIKIAKMISEMNSEQYHKKQNDAITEAKKYLDMVECQRRKLIIDGKQNYEFDPYEQLFILTDQKGRQYRLKKRDALDSVKDYIFYDAEIKLV